SGALYDLWRKPTLIADVVQRQEAWGARPLRRASGQHGDQGGVPVVAVHEVGLPAGCFGKRGRGCAELDVPPAVALVAAVDFPGLGWIAELDQVDARAAVRRQLRIAERRRAR